jgi:hypothetical protein
MLKSPTKNANVEIKSLAGELQKFRVKLEREGGPIQMQTVNAGLFLYDLIEHLQFGTAQYEVILGKSGWSFVEMVLKKDK